jgi:hypothetical protein
MPNGVASVEGPQKWENMSQQFHFQVHTFPQIKSSIYMFKPALFTITKTWKQPEYLLTDKWIKKKTGLRTPGGPWWLRLRTPNAGARVPSHMWQLRPGAAI